MSNRRNPDNSLQFQVKYSVRKALDQAFSNTQFIVLGKQLRILLHESDGVLDFILQVDAEPFSLMFIIRNRRIQLGLGVVMKNDRLHEYHEYFSRNSANT